MHAGVADLFQKRRLTLIAGPCVAESWPLCRDLAQTIAALAAENNMGYIFKASFDKANRTSASSFRGPGMQEGLQILARVQQECQVPVLTDIHHPEQAAIVAEVADVLQIPAFLCRQSDLLHAAAATGKPTNIKKGQFLAPQDMQYVVEKFRQAKGQHVAVTERGTSFGYHQLVVDMCGLAIMRQTTHAPVVFDATHSVQMPGANHGSTGGDRRLAPILARAATAVGIDGLFCEVHFDPDNALSDGPNSLNITMLKTMLTEVSHLHAALSLGQVL